MLNAFITSSELPSKLNLENPSSVAKESALAIAIASTRSNEKGSWIFFEREASTCPRSFQIITPNPTFSMSLNVAPSRLILRQPSGGGIIATRLEDEATVWERWTLFAWWKSTKACWEIGSAYEMGCSLLLTLNWFLQNQIFHKITAINSTLYCASVT